MKKILSIALFCTTISFLFGQDNQKYIVFIFNYRWTSGGWNTGDFLWAIPYDSCHNPIDNNNIIPLFAEEGQILDLNDSVISNQSFGEWPVGDYLPKGSDLWSLYRNRRLIHKIDYKYIPDKRKRTTNIYMVPIIAKISKRKFGYYKEDIFLLESLDNIWEEFWDKEDEAWHYILQHDFCGYNFIVSPGYSFNR